MFNNEQYFAHHSHLPEQGFFGDEGAANHTRLCDSHGETGLELFVFGASAFNSKLVKPVKFPAINWLFWAQGSAPFLGGGFGHFYAYADEKQEYPINRFAENTLDCRSCLPTNPSISKRNPVYGI